MNTEDLPIYQDEAEHGVATGIILSIVTFGLYFFIWKHKQFRTLNICLGDNRFSILSYILLGICTMSLYWIYHSYKTAAAIQEVQRMYSFPQSSDLPLVSLLCSLFGFGLIATAIQQGVINNLVEDTYEL